MPINTRRARLGPFEEGRVSEERNSSSMIATVDAGKMTFPCPICQVRIGVPVRLCGKRARCPKCAQVIPVPVHHPSEAIDLFVGRQLGPYKLLRRLGRGGRGVVYEAEEAKIRRMVAVKILAPEIVAAAESLERFVREAQSAARIEHPNVITIYTVGEQDGTVYIAMSLIRGGSLQDRLSAGQTFSFADLTGIIKSTARGLAAVHAAGIVHRDIKAGNIMLSDAGEVKLADFGTAKITDGSVSALTEPGHLVGTPQYMSPEQCRGTPVDARSDIYSLGATYYRLLAGRAPFSDANPLAIVRMHMDVPHPDPRSFNPDIPATCVRIIDKALAKDPAQRYRTATEMADALETVERSLRQMESIHSDASRKPAADPSDDSDFDPGVLDENALAGILDEDSHGDRELKAITDDASPPPFTPPAEPTIIASGDSTRLPPVRAASGMFAPVSADAGRPIQVDYTFRFTSVDEAKKALDYLRKDLRSVLRRKVISPTFHRGTKVGLLEFNALLTPDEHLGLAKSLVCAKGEILSLNPVDTDPETARKLRFKASQIRAV